MNSKTEQKIIRILRLRVIDKPGYLAKIATSVGDLNANIGEISILEQGHDFLLREISLQLDDEKHLQQVIDDLSKLEGVKIDSVLDPVQQIHEGGKIIMRSRIQLDSVSQLQKIYTPGVAQICKLIEKDPRLSRRYTSIANTVAIVTNGTAILGLGNIGPLAGLPVMEGKAVLFEQLVGISAVPILIESTEIDAVVNAIKDIAITFGAIQLEDIASPSCFEIEDKLQSELSIPVLHDDQHGTAVVVLAVLLTISNQISKNLPDCRIGLIGLGAAGMGIAKLLRSYGVSEISGCDLQTEALNRFSAIGGTPCDLIGVMHHSDIVVATTGCPDLIKPDMVQKGQVILALSNPEPEIDPKLALNAGARLAADGRTINNALAFPGLFKGALQAGATRFTDAMKIAAARAISEQTKKELLAPSILDREVHAAVSNAVQKSCK